MTRFAFTPEARLFKLVEEYSADPSLAVEFDRLGLIDCMLSLPEHSIPETANMRELAVNIVHSYSVGAIHKSLLSLPRLTRHLQTCIGVSNGDCYVLESPITR